MGLLMPHRDVAPAPRAPTDARGDHARPPPRILRLFSAVAKCQISKIRRFGQPFSFFSDSLVYCDTT
jgi:hypothetical protein